MQMMFQTMQSVAMILGAVVLVAIANPPIIPVLLPLAYVFIKVRPSPRLDDSKSAHMHGHG